MPPAFTFRALGASLSCAIQTMTLLEGGGGWSKRWLAATGAKFGTDSNEYEAVGGTRTSERKKKKPKGSGGAHTPKLNNR